MGRQVRYGEPPNEPGTVLGADVTREHVWNMVLHLSPLIDDFEWIDLRLAVLDKQVSGSQKPKDGEAEAVLGERAAWGDKAIAHGVPGDGCAD
jgi:hypothetical protein